MAFTGLGLQSITRTIRRVASRGRCGRATWPKRAAAVTRSCRPPRARFFRNWNSLHHTNRNARTWPARAALRLQTGRRANCGSRSPSNIPEFLPPERTHRGLSRALSPGTAIFGRGHSSENLLGHPCKSALIRGLPFMHPSTAHRRLPTVHSGLRPAMTPCGLVILQ